MNILIKPLLTERMTAQGEKLGVYGFVVNPAANKIQIKAAVEEQYGVVVKSVNTSNYDGRVRSRYTKAGFLSGRNNNFKKAFVTLKEGDTIDFYGNI